MDSPSQLGGLIPALARPPRDHAPGSEAYTRLAQTAAAEARRLFSGTEEVPRNLTPFGEIVFPYRKMGSVDSVDLFGLDELIVFSFYWTNRGLYRSAADIGANIGLHSIILDRCGCSVRAYEPDPRHFEILRRNLELNRCSKVTPVNAAVSSQAGQMEFVRVLGNTTSSHLAGSKPNPYGDLERFPVRVEAIASAIEGVDLVKLDVEGHEKDILLATAQKHWSRTDLIVEIGGAENAEAVFGHFREIGVNLFAQKRNWERVERVEDVPVNYREGLLFASCRDRMPWG